MKYIILAIVLYLAAYIALGWVLYHKIFYHRRFTLPEYAAIMILILGALYITLHYIIII